MGFSSCFITDLFKQADVIHRGEITNLRNNFLEQKILKVKKTLGTYFSITDVNDQMLRLDVNYWGIGKV